MAGERVGLLLTGMAANGGFRREKQVGNALFWALTQRAVQGQ